MKVFLSWSGEKSRAVAEALREWLPYINPEIEPSMSDSDIGPSTVVARGSYVTRSKAPFGTSRGFTGRGWTSS